MTNTDRHKQRQKRKAKLTQKWNPIRIPQIHEVEKEVNNEKFAAFVFIAGIFIGGIILWLL